MECHYFNVRQNKHTHTKTVDIQPLEMLIFMLNSLNVRFINVIVRKLLKFLTSNQLIDYFREHLKFEDNGSVVLINGCYRVMTDMEDDELYECEEYNSHWN